MDKKKIQNILIGAAVIIWGVVVFLSAWHDLKQKRKLPFSR